MEQEVKNQRTNSVPSLLTIAHFSLISYLFVAPLSIAASHISMGVFLLASIILFVKKHDVLSYKNYSSLTLKLGIPIIAWCLVSLCVSMFGVAPGRSVSAVLKIAFYGILPFCVAAIITAAFSETGLVLKRICSYATALFVGQLIASIHTLTSSSVGYSLPPKLPGAVTEAGQLVLVIPLLIAIVFGLKSFSKESQDSPRMYLTLAIAMFLGALLFAWPTFSGTSITYIIQGASLFSLITLATYLFLSLKRLPLDKESIECGLKRYFIFLAVPLLLAAWIVNLKRGPWLGCSFAIFIFGWIVYRRIAYVTLGLVAFSLIALAPARNRVLEFADHFSISGGRQQMWELGLDIIQKNPLGLGFKNADYMRVLDPSLPKTHRHMHNNLINMSVETGWLGLGCYLWWMWVAIKMGFDTAILTARSHEKEMRFIGLIALGCATALLGWQVAGLVEYNFGDTEIRLLAFTYMGIILASTAYAKKALLGIREQ